MPRMVNARSCHSALARWRSVTSGSAPSVRAAALCERPRSGCGRWRGLRSRTIAASELLNPSQRTSMTRSPCARAGAGRRSPEPRWRRRHRVPRPHPPDVFGASRSGPRVVVTNRGGWRGRACDGEQPHPLPGRVACRHVAGATPCLKHGLAEQVGRILGTAALFPVTTPPSPVEGTTHRRGKALSRMQRRCIGQPNNDTLR